MSFETNEMDDIINDFLTEASESLEQLELKADPIHPNAKGYENWAEAILPAVKEMLGSQ